MEELWLKNNMAIEFSHGCLIVRQGILYHNSYSDCLESSIDSSILYLSIQFRVSTHFEQLQKSQETKADQYRSRLVVDKDFAKNIDFEVFFSEIKSENRELPIKLNVSSFADFLNPKVWSKTKFINAKPMPPIMLELLAQVELVTNTIFDWCRVDYCTQEVSGKVSLSTLHDEIVATKCDCATIHLVHKEKPFKNENCMIFKVLKQEQLTQQPWSHKRGTNVIDHCYDSLDNLFFDESNESYLFQETSKRHKKFNH